MPFCRKCGTRIKEEGLFCPKCGLKLLVNKQKTKQIKETVSAKKRKVTGKIIEESIKEAVSKKGKEIKEEGELIEETEIGPGKSYFGAILIILVSILISYFGASNFSHSNLVISFLIFVWSISSAIILGKYFAIEKSMKIIMIGILLALTFSGLAYTVAWTFGAIKLCGDGRCDSIECSQGCKKDCDILTCKNTICESLIGEDCSNSEDCECSADEICDPSRSSNQKGCYKTSCGDKYCDGPLESKNTCCSDCGCDPGYSCMANQCQTECGDGICTGGETSQNCCSDCRCGTGYECNYATNICQMAQVQLDLNYVPATAVSPILLMSDPSYLQEPVLSNFIIKNPGNLVMQGVVVGVKLGDYSDWSYDSSCGDISGGNECLISEINPVPNDLILSIQEKTTVPLHVEVKYKDFEGKEQTYEESTNTNINGRNYIEFWKPDIYAAWVTYREDTVRNFASQATKGIATYEDSGAKQAAKALFDALCDHSIDYVTDLDDPIGGTDYMQFPGETLKRGGGDCDDLAVLYATLLESVGIESFLVGVPEHLFAGYVEPKSRYYHFVETTGICWSFEDAESYGSDTYNYYESENQVTITIPRDIWAVGYLKPVDIKL